MAPATSRTSGEEREREREKFGGNFIKSSVETYKQYA